MKKLILLMLLLTAACYCGGQEPRSNSFEDFVFKTPVAYKTGYSNETERITSIYDIGPYTAISFTEEFSMLADSTDVYIEPLEFLYDPATKKRYHLIFSSGVPKFKKVKYLKGKLGQTTKHNLKYILFFNRIPSDVRYVEFHHAPKWEKPDECYASVTFYDIDLSCRKSLDNEGEFKWINLTPKADETHYFTPLTVTKKGEDAEGKSDVEINLAYRNVDKTSSNDGSYFTMHNNLYLYDPVKKKSYSSTGLSGIRDGKEEWLKGWDIYAFGCKFAGVDSDTDVVDVMAGDTCIIKGLHLKP